MKCHNYIFLTTNTSFYALPKAVQAKCKSEFIKALQREKEVITYTYATVGMKAHTNILIWFQANTIEAIQLFLNSLMHTQLGQYMQITYTLFGMVRPTQYSSQSTIHLRTERKGGKYLIIYPFTKTKEWYMLDFDTRRKLMGGHVMIGKKFP